MNKKVIYSMTIATLLAASAAFAGGVDTLATQGQSPFSGLYVGGNLSYHQTGFDINSSTTLFNTITTPPTLYPFQIQLNSQNGGDSSSDAYFGTRLGWGKVFNRWYVGLEGFADFGDAHGAISNTLLPAAFTSPNVTNSAKIGNNFGLDGKFGFLLSPTTLAYTRLGASWAQIKSSVSFNIDTTDIAASNSHKDLKPGFIWGFGTEQFVWKDRVSVFGEYTHESFGSVSTSTTLPIVENRTINPGVIGLTFDSSSKAKVSAFTGGVNFYVFKNWL